MNGDQPNGTARWQLLVSMAAVGVVVFGALVSLSWTANSAFEKADELRGRLDRLEQQESADRAQLVSVCADLVEVETQFRAADQVRNLMHVNDLRTQSIIWRKTFGTDYPIGDPYLPTIAREEPSPCR